MHSTPVGPDTVTADLQGTGFGGRPPELPARWELQSRTAVLPLAWLAVEERVSGVAAALGDLDAAEKHCHRAAALAPRCWFGQRPNSS